MRATCAPQTSLRPPADGACLQLFPHKGEVRQAAMIDQLSDGVGPGFTHCRARALRASDVKTNPGMGLLRDHTRQARCQA